MRPTTKDGQESSLENGIAFQWDGEVFDKGNKKVVWTWGETQILDNREDLVKVLKQITREIEEQIQ